MFVEPAAGRNDPRRKILLELFRSALESVDGRLCVKQALALGAGSAPSLAGAPGGAHGSSAAGAGTAAAGSTGELSPAAEGAGNRAPVWAAAIGKAASAMMLGAQDALGASLERGLVITKDDHVAPQLYTSPNVEVIESAHPMPDDRSLAAGERLLRWVDELPPNVEPLFLISGGASSLVESLVPGATFAQLTALNARGLASGMAIGELNAQRAQLSQIKGGRLAARLAGRPARAFFISDVPGHDPAVIGSGLMGPAPSAAHAGGEGDRVERTVVASIDHAMERVRVEARKRGLSVSEDARVFDGAVERLAVRFAHELHMSPHQVCVWGGESTVQLPENPGRGGRNQHLALAAARIIAGHDNLLLLVAGTDGTDGVTSDAGALVDGETCSRVALSEIDVQASLQCADSGTALAAAGDLIHTGPTGTNVGDIVIGLKLSREAAEGFVARP
jgi:hydroxypyruvate reductase